MLTNVSETCKIHETFSPVLPFLPDTGNVRHEICMMHVQALPNVNTTETWFGRNGYFKGSNQGFNKHASKTQTEHTGTRAVSGMARRRGFWTRSLQTAWEWTTLSLSSSRNASGTRGMLKSDHCQHAVGSPWIVGLNFVRLVIEFV